MAAREGRKNFGNTLRLREQAGIVAALLVRAVHHALYTYPGFGL
jgi:hypothetical protein